MALNPITPPPKQFQNPIIQIVLIALIIVLASWFVILPKYREYGEKAEQLAQFEAEFMKVDKDKQAMQQLITQMKAAGIDLQLVDEALPLNGRITKFELLIDTLATAAGMEVSQITMEGTDPTVAAGNKVSLTNPFEHERKLQATTVTMTLTGSPEQLRSFLQLVETNGRILDVTGIDMTAGEGETRFRLKIKAYAYESV